MKGGSLVAMGTPEELLRRAEGSVWAGVMASTELDVMRARLTISSAVRKADGVHLRVVSGEQPFAGAIAAEPTLEDAYLCTMTGRAA